MTASTRQALVTGGANGIGRGIVAHLLDEGWRVVALDRDGEGLEGLGAREGLGTVVADVSDEASVSRAVAGLNRLDLLVSNAGIADPVSGPVEALSLDEWNARIAVNLTGTFLMVKHCAALLRAARGSVVTMSSTRARMSEPDGEAYAASKGGIEALTHALAISLGPAVRVNGIAPGWIVTEGWDALSGMDQAQHPVGRAGRLADVARAVSYLADAEFMTGQILVLDGGMTRKMIYAE